MELGGDFSRPRRALSCCEHSSRAFTPTRLGGIHRELDHRGDSGRTRLSPNTTPFIPMTQLGGVKRGVAWRGNLSWHRRAGVVLILPQIASDQFPCRLGEMLSLGDREAPAIELFRTSIDRTGSIHPAFQRGACSLLRLANSCFGAGHYLRC